MQSRKNKLFVYLLILILSFIFWQICSQLLIFQTLTEQKTHIFTYLLQTRSENCWYYQYVYNFQFPRCEQAKLGQKYLITGTINELSDTKLSQQITLNIQSILPISPKRTWGSIWLNQIRLSCDKINQRLVSWVRRALPFTQGELMLGLVLGADPSFLDSFEHKIKVTGMQHVLVASGFNISLVSMLMFQVLSPLLSSRWLRAIMVTWAVIVYSLILGISAPLTRAVVMAVLSIWARLVVCRQYRALHGLLLAAGGMLAFYPAYLFNISFQLSMMATLGIIWFVPLFSRSNFLSSLMVNNFNELSAFKSDQTNVLTRLSAFFGEALLVTVAAQLLVLPLLLHHFGQLSLLSVIANTLLTWMTPILTVAGFIYLVAMSLLSRFTVLTNMATTLFALGLWWPIKLYLSGIEWLGSYSSALINTPELSDNAVVIWWVLLFIWSTWWTRKKQLQPFRL